MSRRAPRYAYCIFAAVFVSMLLLPGLSPSVSNSTREVQMEAVGGGTPPVLTQAVEINNNSAKTRGSPSAALDSDGTLYVVWEDARSGSEHIYFASSTDGGLSFGQNKRVDDAPKSGSRQLRPVIAVANDGDLFVAWQDNRRHIYDFDIYFAYSRDGGKSFSQNIKVDDSQPDPISWQERPSITVDSAGNPAIAWTDDRTGIMKIRIATSVNGGQSFGPSKEVTAGALGIHGQTGVSIKNSGTRLWASFTDNYSGLPHPYLAWSTDGGATFSQPLRLDGGTNVRQRSVVLASLPDNGVIAVWEDQRMVNWDLYGSTISATGAVTASNIQISDGDPGSNQVNPSVVVDPTGIYVAWEDDRLSKFAVRVTHALIGTTSFSSSVDVDTPGGDQLQSNPCAAASKNRGGFFVVWEDSSMNADEVLEARGYVPGQAAPWIWPLGTSMSLPGASMTLTATAYDPDSITLRYTWNFGDGSGMKVGNLVSHVYGTSGRYTLTVYVDDLAGTPGHNVSTTGIALIGFTLQLSAGWTFVNLPLIGTNYMASTLGLATGDMIANWNPAAQVFDKSYIVGLSPPSMDFAIVPGTGYWVYAKAQEMIVVGGTIATAPQSKLLGVPSGGGWAMVGLCSLNIGLKASNLVSMFTGLSGARMTTVSTWNPATQTYVTYVSGYPINDFLMIPGQGYWVFLTGAGIVAYTP